MVMPCERETKSTTRKENKNCTHSNQFLSIAKYDEKEEKKNTHTFKRNHVFFVCANKMKLKIAFFLYRQSMFSIWRWREGKRKKPIGFGVYTNFDWKFVRWCSSHLVARACFTIKITEIFHLRILNWWMGKCCTATQ